MHLGSLESTQEARVALGCASSYSYASFVLSKVPACIHNSIYAKRGDEWSLRAFECSQRPFVTPLSERLIREHASTEIFFASTSRDKKFALQAASGLESATCEQGALLILSACSNPYGKPFL